MKRLQPGDEVALTYGPEKGRMVTCLRKRLLGAQYHFECRRAPPALAARAHRSSRTLIHRLHGRAIHYLVQTSQISCFSFRPSSKP